MFLFVFFFFLFLFFFCFFFFFFFSSRRRHTRLTCDWSSDVCSSDLPAFCGKLPTYVDNSGWLVSIRVTTVSTFFRESHPLCRELGWLTGKKIGRASCRERV